VPPTSLRPDTTDRVSRMRSPKRTIEI
jgi:hypothetical protein